MDWPNWRGPEQNRISRETGLIDKWDPDSGENVLWKCPQAAGISSPIVMNGKVYMQVRYKPDTKDEQEEVICLDADTGQSAVGEPLERVSCPTCRPSASAGAAWWAIPKPEISMHSG